MPKDPRLEELERRLADTERALDLERATTARHMREADLRHALALRAASSGQWEWNIAADTITCAPHIKATLGYEDDEFRPNFAIWSDMVHPDDRERVRRIVRAHLEHGAPYETEHRLRTKSGEYRWIRSVGQVERGDDGVAERVVGYHAEVHERKLAELTLGDSERKFRALFEGTSTAVTLRDFRGQGLVDCNAAALRLYGYDSIDEILGETPAVLSAEHQPDGTPSRIAMRGHIERALEHGIWRCEWLARRRDGQTFPSEVRIEVIELEGRRLMQTMIEDITERKATERARARHAERDALVSRISTRFVHGDAAGAILFALEGLARFVGVDRARIRTFVDTTDFRTIHEWHAPGSKPTSETRVSLGNAGFRWVYEQIARGEVVAIANVDTLSPALLSDRWDTERKAMLLAPLATPSATTGWLSVDSVEPRAWSEEDIAVIRLVAELVAMGRARAEAEAAMRESETRYRSLIERSRDAICTLDFEGRVLFASPSVIEIFGYSPEELTTDPDIMQRRLVSGPGVGTVKEQLRALVDSAMVDPSATSEWAFLRKDGRVVYVDTMLMPIRSADGKVLGLQTVARDVTERRREEKAARRRAGRDVLISAITRRFLDDDPDVATDESLEQLGAKLDAERVSIFAPDEAQTRLHCTHRWRRAGAELAWESLEAFPVPSGIFTPLEALGNADSGSPVGHGAPPPVERWLATLHRDSGKRLLHTPIGYGGRLFGLLTVRAPEGRSWDEEDAATLRAVGELIAVARVRRAAEIALGRAKEDAIAASLTKSAFLANMSHELRTPLNGVIGMVDLLTTTPLDERQKRYTEVARASAGLLLSVINDILDFSKIEAGKLEIERIEFSFTEVFEEVASILALSAEEKGLELCCFSSPELSLPLVGDPGRIRQVLVNLVSNAIKFTSRGEISLRATRTDDAAFGARVRVEVTDTGIGIPDAAMNKLFRPFSQVDASTTREHGGTGLGLAICRELVGRMGGDIGVTSKVDVGSTFWFTVQLDTPEEGSFDATVIDPRLAGIRVLGVDDNATNCEILHTQLTAAGMLCDTTADGASALGMLLDAVERRPYHLVVLDRHMPVMDGLELARRIRAEPRLARTRLVMLGSVGRPFDVTAQRALGIAGYGTKPIWRKQLLRVLRAALDEPTGMAERSPIESRRPAAEGGDGAGIRILLVEDSAINAEVAGELLRTAGYAFDLAVDGKHAVQAMMTRTYALVLMDCQLPEMDGYEATRRIRSLEEAGGLPGGRARPVPIVALTASATKEDLARCFESGMDDHVPKPVDARRLLATIAEHTKSEGKAPLSQRRLPRATGPVVCNMARALERLQGNRALLARITARFAEEAPRARARLREAVERRDRGETAFIAHRLRGQAASFDAEVLVLSIEVIEGASERFNWSAAGAALLAFEIELDRLLAALASER